MHRTKLRVRVASQQSMIIYSSNDKLNSRHSNNSIVFVIALLISALHENTQKRLKEIVVCEIICLVFLK